MVTSEGPVAAASGWGEGTRDSSHGILDVLASKAMDISRSEPRQGLALKNSSAGDFVFK